MKTILFVLIFFNGQSSANVAAAPSFEACEQSRIELVREIVNDPQITSFVVACHRVTDKPKKGVGA